MKWYMLNDEWLMVSYVCAWIIVGNGEHKSVWLNEKEFTVKKVKRRSIGFV